MFRLDDILERWSVIHDRLRHNPSADAKPEDCSFFRIDRMELENAFTRNFNVLKSGAVCCACVNFDGQLDDHRPRFALYHWQLYLAMKQQSDANYIQDAKAAADTKYDINDLVLDLIAFLFAAQDFIDGRSLKPDTPQCVRDLFNGLSDEERRGLKGLRMDATEWWSTPRWKNGWWLIGVELYGLASTQLCITPSHYISDTALPSDLSAPPSRPPRRGRKP